MNRTDEQQAFIDTVAKGGHFVGQARAGTGKSTIIFEIARELSRNRIKVAVFNKALEVETNKNPKKPANLEAKTYHSLCLAELRSKVRGIRIDSDGSKVRELIIKNVGDPYERGISNEEKMVRSENFSAMKQLVSLAKNYSIELSFMDIVNIMIKYRIDPAFDRKAFAEMCLEIVRKSDDNDTFIDFDDMIRFAAIRELGKQFHGDMFIVDEAQDNTRMRTIIMGQATEFMQVGAVGDDRQAIYAFAGADSESMSNIITTLGIESTLPLTINFRCDKSIIREAQKIVPDINFFSEKEEGYVREIENAQFSEQFLPGHVAIARYNKVIISKCFSLIREGKPATIQGKDFGSMLKNMIGGFKASDMDDFRHKLDSWYEKQCKYSEDNQPSDAIVDRYDCLVYLSDHCETVQQIGTRIDAIFSDATDANTYKFSTAHKSKGLEWDYVHILDNKNFMSRDPRNPAHQVVQEENLKYIATTRARHGLTLVNYEDKKDPTKENIAEKEFSDEVDKPKANNETKASRFARRMASKNTPKNREENLEMMKNMMQNDILE